MYNIQDMRNEEIFIQVSNVKGFEDVKEKYTVTNYGDVWEKKNGRAKIVEMKEVDDVVFVSLKTEDGKTLNVDVKYLVAMAFLNEDGFGFEEVRNINGDKYDNHISNLDTI